MQQGSEQPLDIRDPHLFRALGTTTNLVIWELLRRLDRPSTVEDLVAASRLRAAAVQVALEAFERVKLVSRKRASAGKRAFGWVVTCPAIVVQFRAGDPQDQALLAKLDGLFDQRRRAEVETKVKPEATRNNRDYSWVSMHAGSFNDDEIQELWGLLQGLTRFFTRTGERFKGAKPGTDHSCTHHVCVTVDPLLPGVLPLPNLQILGQQAAAGVAAGIAADWTRALTKREAEIALELARGTKSKALAAELKLSAHTVVEYTRRIYKKLGVKNRVELSRRIQAG
jgi:DNA-binding CsgD family transcriptional regulator